MASHGTIELRRYVLLLRVLSRDTDFGIVADQTEKLEPLWSGREDVNSLSGLPS